MKGAIYLIIGLITITTVMAGIQQQATQDGKVIINIKPGDTISLKDMPYGNTIAVQTDQPNTKLQIQITGDIQEITTNPETITIEKPNTWTKPEINFTVSPDTIIGGKYTGAIKIIEINDCEGCNINNQLAIKKYIDINIAEESSITNPETAEATNKLPEEEKQPITSQAWFQFGGIALLLTCVLGFIYFAVWK